MSCRNCSRSCSWAAPPRQQTSFPTHPVRLIVAFTPGGTTDVTARLIADTMHDALGGAVAVGQKPGANGAVAAQYVAHARILTATHCSSPRSTPSSSIPPSAPICLTTRCGSSPRSDAAGRRTSPPGQRRPESKLGAVRNLRRLPATSPARSRWAVHGRGAMSDLGLQLFEAAAGIGGGRCPIAAPRRRSPIFLPDGWSGLVGDVPTAMARVHAPSI